MRHGVFSVNFALWGAPREEFLDMCDYSLHHVASRPAKVGDKLVTTQFNHSITRGFARGRTKRSGVPSPRHGGCVREGDRVRAWVWSFLKLGTSKENWRQGSPLPAAERGQAEHASRCTRVSRRRNLVGHSAL